MNLHLPQAVRLQRAQYNDLDAAEQVEWWLADGKGGYAGGTVAGTLTRRYHGLLIAPLQSSPQRHLLFAKADADLLDGERVIPLHSNRWRSGAINPQGHALIESFHLDGRMPVWRYRVDDLLIEARIWMEHGNHGTDVAWRLLENPTGRQVRLRARLLVDVRDHHAAMDNCELPRVVQTQCGLNVELMAGTTLYFCTHYGTVERADFRVEDFDLPAERARGLPATDHHWCVGYLTFPLHHGDWVGFNASLEECERVCYLESDMQAQQARDLCLLTRTKITAPEFDACPLWIDQLLLAADSFIIQQKLPRSETRHAVVAGYPWFGEWGRDSMIALPGLLLATGRYEEARSLLLGYLPLVDGGMLPNYFPGDGEAPQYNTVDAALWYIEAWCAYLVGVQDFTSIAQAWPVLQQIVAHYRDGTRHSIRMDAADGLLRAGEPGVQLTWMDAKVDDFVVTPRQGKPVEVNALWYNALRTMAQFATVLKDVTLAHEYTTMADKTRNGFRRFIRADGQGLYDVLDGPNGDDASIRPNQIFAVSLPFSALEALSQQQVVDCCREHLLTPFGLRSLAPSDAAYRPRYEGDVWSRDTAYHQGTVWAWLLGHYALAEFRVTDDAALSLSRLDAMQDHLKAAGLGTVSEIFDGDAPHTPRGAPSQAWSVACLLEAYWKLRRAQIEQEKA